MIRFSARSPGDDGAKYTGTYDPDLPGAQEAIDFLFHLVETGHTVKLWAVAK